VVETQPYFKAEISKLKDSKPKNKEEYEALLENVKDLALKSLSWILIFRMQRILPSKTSTTMMIFEFHLHQCQFPFFRKAKASGKKSDGKSQQVLRNDA
jgi:hypothetical protein